MFKLVSGFALIAGLAVSGCSATLGPIGEVSYLEMRSGAETCFVRTFNGLFADTICQKGDVLRYSETPLSTSKLATARDAEAIPGYVLGLFDAMGRATVTLPHAPVVHETYHSPKSL